MGGVQVNAHSSFMTPMTVKVARHRLRSHLYMYLSSICVGKNECTGHEPSRGISGKTFDGWWFSGSIWTGRVRHSLLQPKVRRAIAVLVSTEITVGRTYSEIHLITNFR